MKHKRTQLAIKYQAEKVLGLEYKPKSNTWTEKDFKTLDEVRKLADGTLSNNMIKEIYNKMTGQNRSDYSISVHLSMLKDPEYKINAKRQKAQKDNRPVRCIETGQVFKNKQECADYFGFKRFNLDCYLNPKKHRKECYGKHFEYVDNV